MSRLLKLSRSNVLKVFKHKKACGDTPFPGITKETILRLDSEYDRLAGSCSESLLKKHLHEKLFHRLKKQKTPKYTCNLLDCIQSGLTHHDSVVGIYAPDSEVFQVYDLLFDPVIEDIHGLKSTDNHPPMNFGKNDFENVDPQNRFVISTRMRIQRNLDGYPFAPKMTESHYKQIEKEVVSTLKLLEGQHEGLYFPLHDTLRAVKLQWIEDHLYKNPNRFMEGGNICRFLPTGRGLFHNLEKTFSVWLNYDDHLRIVSMQRGGNFCEVYQRLIEGLDMIESYHPFVCDKHLGFLTCDPVTLGTTLRASVHIKLLKLCMNECAFKEVLDKFNLQVRGTYGAYTDVEKGIYDISNKRCVGLTEHDIVRQVFNGVAEIIKMEKSIKGTCRLIK